MHPYEPFRSGAPTHILVHSRVHRAHRLKTSADLVEVASKRKPNLWEKVIVN